MSWPGYSIVILALLLANLPFVSERIVGLFSWQKNIPKSPRIQLIECVFFYFLIGVYAYFLEVHSGEYYPKNWVFFTITGCFFLICAIPGFIWRYLWQRHQAKPLKTASSNET